MTPVPVALHPAYHTAIGPLRRDRKLRTGRDAERRPQLDTLAEENDLGPLFDGHVDEWGRVRCDAVQPERA